MHTKKVKKINGTLKENIIWKMLKEIANENSDKNIPIKKIVQQKV